MSNLREILINKKICKSVWFMRQAGRYLTEFKKIRSKNQNFIELCLNSNLSSEITLQPIKRFDLDSAIIFSDILIVPHALGQKVSFIKDKGPELNQFNLERFLENDKSTISQKLNPVYEAIKKTRKNLKREKSLISFVGAPWTLLVYMLNAKKGKNEIDYKKIKDNNLDISLILNKLNDYLCNHIENQINAGADVVQIFDSWAGLLRDEDLMNFSYLPNLKIVEFCKKKKVPVICFPKGIKEKYKKFNEVVKPSGLNIDYDVEPQWAKDNLKNTVIQGGLDPKVLLLPEKDMLDGAEKYLSTFKDLPYIFDLGHGILPETEPDKVDKLVRFYRKY